jgi:ankyrin repeat protein
MSPIFKSIPEGNTALHVAVSEQQHELLKFLLKKGADTSIKNNSGKTPPDLAKDIKDKGAEKILSETPVAL